MNDELVIALAYDVVRDNWDIIQIDQDRPGSVEEFIRLADGGKLTIAGFRVVINNCK